MRYVWIDWAKVICIWLMVSCHAGQSGMFLNVSYQFHMPAFFIISGFLFHPRGIKKEFMSFCIPILLYGFLYLIFSCFAEFSSNEFNYNRGYSLIVSWMKSLLFRSDVSWFQGYWFVATLLFIRLLMECDYIRKKYYFIAIFCIVYCCIEPYANISYFIMGLKPYHLLSCFPFFALGMLIKEKNIEITQSSLEILLLELVCFFVLTLVQGRPDLGEYCYGACNYVLFFVNAIIGSHILFNICNYLPQRSWIQTLSSGTLLILGIHSIIYRSLFRILNSFIVIDNFYLPLFVGIITVIICYYLIKFLGKKYPLMLGKIK